MDINIPSQIKLFANLSSFPLTGEVKTLYIDQSTANHYYWSGSAYVQLTDGTKFPTPTGTTSEYLRGDGSLATFPTIPDTSDFVAKSDFTSHSILAKQSGAGDPVAVSIGNNEILGRKSGGGSNIEGLSVSEVKSILNYTASDVGAPSGSGTSTGTNTGDETETSILTKLGITKLKVTGDQSTTSTTAVDITDLVSGTLPVGKYSVSGSIGVGSTTTAGLKIGITIPSGATMRIRATDRGSTPNNAVNEIFNSSGTLSTSNFAQVNGDSVVFFEGTITITTPGVVQFIFAKTTSGTATIYDEGTQLKIEKW
jgi:hypothetical protein